MLNRLRELVEDLRRSQSAYDKEAADHLNDFRTAKCQGKAQAFGEAADRIMQIIIDNDTEE